MFVVRVIVKEFEQNSVIAHRAASKEAAWVSVKRGPTKLSEGESNSACGVVGNVLGFGQNARQRGKVVPEFREKVEADSAKVGGLLGL